MAFSRYIKFTSDIEAIEELPRDLSRVLKQSGIEVGADVMLEDEGWGITFHHKGAVYRFCSRFNQGSEPLECMGWLESDTKRGFFASLFGPRESHSYPEIEPIIQTAFSRLQNVREIAWCSGDDER